MCSPGGRSVIPNILPIFICQSIENFLYKFGEIFIFCNVTYKLVENMEKRFEYGQHITNLIHNFVVWNCYILLGIFQYNAVIIICLKLIYLFPLSYILSKRHLCWSYMPETQSCMYIELYIYMHYRHDNELTDLRKSLDSD